MARGIDTCSSCARTRHAQKKMLRAAVVWSLAASAACFLGGPHAAPALDWRRGRARFAARGGGLRCAAGAPLRMTGGAETPRPGGGSCLWGAARGAAWGQGAGGGRVLARSWRARRCSCFAAGWACMQGSAATGSRNPRPFRAACLRVRVACPPACVRACTCLARGQQRWASLTAR